MFMLLGSLALWKYLALLPFIAAQENFLGTQQPKSVPLCKTHRK